MNYPNRTEPHYSSAPSPTILANCLQIFPLEPGRARREMRRLLQDDPAGFHAAAIRELADDQAHTSPLPSSESDGREFLRRLVLAEGSILDILCDPDACSLEEASRLASTFAKMEAPFEALLRRRIPPQLRLEDEPKTERIIQILAAFAEPRRLATLLSRFLSHPSARVRATVVRLSGSHCFAREWFARVLKDPDPRVRANGVEALWGRKSDDVKELLTLAGGDPHHRVAANALVGLCLAGDESGRSKIEQMMEHTNAAFQSAACWAAGYVADPAFVPRLTAILNGSKGLTRANALGALAAIRRKQQAASEAETASVESTS